VKKSLTLFIVALTSILLSGCLDNGSSAAPPTNMVATAGDGRVKVTWTGVSGVDYWLFTATDMALSALNWTGLPNAHVYINASSPYYLCGLLNDKTYYFVTNGRINGGPGGASSLQVNAMPYNAITKWAVTPAASGVPASINLNGVGYASLTTCSNNTTSSSGQFAAVGAGGAIYTSADNGQTWTAHTPFTSDLNAITGYAANQNNSTTPALLWVAVGAGGATTYSNDQGVTWLPGRMIATPANPSLNAITQVTGTFFAVGDQANIYSTTDGTNWVTHTPATTVTTSNLHGIAHGTNYVAVGDNGTILTSGDGSTWTAQTTVANSIPTINLRHVTANGNIIVAVGDGGTIVTSKDAGATWVVQTPFGATNLVGVAAEFQYKENDVVDKWLGIVPTVQFIAIDSSGNAYTTKSDLTSANGMTWTTTTTTGASSLNALVSSGFGYVAVGNAGATTTAF
jgi:photosystem II stability/assembly factor-like uncharacterized protein